MEVKLWCLDVSLVSVWFKHLSFYGSEALVSGCELVSVWFKHLSFYGSEALVSGCELGVSMLQAFIFLWK